MSRLRLLHASRVFQHQNAPQIVGSILLRDNFMDHQFVFRLRREYPVHAFRLQYQMSDFDFIRLLCEQEGIYFYVEQGKHGDVVVFGDDIDHYVYTPELRVPYRENSGLEAGVEAVIALETHAEVVPKSVMVADYNPLVAWERFREEANVAISDTTTYGQPYVYGTNHLSQDGAKWEAQLRHEAAIAWQVVYHGQSNVLQLRPGRILRIDEALPDAPSGQVIIEVSHSGGRGVAYSNSYKAIPSDRRFRLKIDESKRPKIHGALSARVTSPNKYPYAYLTNAGHYPVRLDLDFDEWNPGGESVPLRMAKPFAGALHTGFHFPVLDGTEAVIMARDGDPNKLFISQFHHNSIQADLIHNQDRWMSRNVIRTQSDNKLEFEDWEGEEHAKLSTRHSGKSQLTLGHIVNGKREKRGKGFELRTDEQGVLRAGGGLMLSSDIQQQADGKQTDMAASMKQFQMLHLHAQGLADLAKTAKAEIADLKGENEWLKSSVNELKEAVMLLSSPKGIALSTPDRVSVGAGKDVNITTTTGFNVNALKSIVMAAGDAMSLFAHNLGIKLLAARGKVEIQAQSDELTMSALKDMTITSTDGKIVISASKELWLGAAGSFIRMTANNVEIATRGDLFEKALAFQKDGPSSEMKKLTLPYTSDLPDTGGHGSKFSG